MMLKFGYLIAGALMALGALAQWVGAPVAAIALFASSMLFSGRGPARAAWRSARARRLDINVLMVIAVAGAIALGDWWEAATVIWLYDLSESLEQWTLRRARQAVRAAVASAPAIALVRRAGEERERPAAEIVPGDTVIIRPGERLPVDGRVAAGESTVDESALTGESRPIDKAPGDEVLGGTLNGLGAIEIVATRPATESAAARVLTLLEDAQARRAPTQQFVDRFARRYTPAVFILAVGLAALPPLVVGLATWPVWIYRALMLLVAACPCALVISTPVAVMAALTAAARQGVLVKGGAHLEAAAAIRCVAFDKTGTLTHGRVAVTDVVAVGGASAHSVLGVAAALECRSEHPIGRAIVTHAEAVGVTIVSGDAFRALPGRGAEATVSAGHAVVGSHRLFHERALCSAELHVEFERLTSQGETTVLVGRDGAGVGVIALADELKDTSAAAVDRLRQSGISHVALLTGDQRPTAERIASAVGIDGVHAELLPGDKVARVHELRERYGPVAMVGDGVNDAPALAAADLGVAMGGRGSDLAVEAADVTLLGDDLRKVPYLVSLGRRTLGVIRANVTVALALKFGFMALAAAGVTSLWMAVFADTGATLIVTANSLRLLRARQEF